MNTFTKLASGDWGVRIEGTAPAVGAKVTVSKRSGASKAVTITGIVSTVGGVTIARIEAGKARAPRRSRDGRVGWVGRLNSGAEIYQNYNGRCEDAPCCGCCNC